MLCKASSPKHLEGMILRSDLREGVDEEGVEGLELPTMVSREAIANLPFARVMNWGIHIWRLLVAIKQAQKTVMTSPAPTLCSLTNFAPNQKPCTNMAIMTNWAIPLVKPQTRVKFFAAVWRFLNDWVALEVS